MIVSNEPRKNVAAVIRAFRTIPQADLTVIGYAGLAQRSRNLPPNVRLVGYVEEHERPR